jgi:hypothetical protein
MSELAVKQAALKEVVDKLDALALKLNAAKEKKANLEAEYELCLAKLDRANKLIGGLGGEKTRWTESAQTLSQELHALSGDMLLAAGFIAYLGPFTSVFRCTPLHCPPTPINTFQKCFSPIVIIQITSKAAFALPEKCLMLADSVPGRHA